MKNDSGKHKKIVRRRIAATVTMVIVGLIIIALLIFGFYKLMDYLMPNDYDETAGAFMASYETGSDTRSSEEGVQRDSSSEASEEPHIELSSEELSLQYEEAVKWDIKTGSALDVEEFLSSMTLEEKVAQLFFLSPEELTGFRTVTQAGSTTSDSLSKYPVGGLIYFNENIVDPRQTLDMLQKTMEYALSWNGIPIFLATDEEGGDVLRLGSNPSFNLDKVDSLQAIGETLNPNKAYKAGRKIGKYLKEYGFNLDFAPVSDVSPGNNNAIGSRSFGSDPEGVAQFSMEFAKGLQERGVFPCIKHYPGFGRAMENTDYSRVSLDITKEELYETDLIPFIEGAKRQIPFIMVGNMAYPNITGDDTPASMSDILVNGILRGELGYSGVVITDALRAEAIKSRYSSAEAAVAALKAGVDMLLLPDDFHEAYEAVLSAVENGELSEDRLDESMRRILRLKLGLDMDSSRQE